MKLFFANKHVRDTLPRRLRQVMGSGGQRLAASAVVFPGVLGFVGHAFAQAQSPAGGIGAQLNVISSESLNAGSIAFGMGCYLAAALCFFFGVWAAWQSRQPQNRETGYVGRAAAGLILCGLFATAGVWVNKAAISASGGNATITTGPAMVTFGQN